MLVLGKAVDMSVSIRGGDFPLGALPLKIQIIVKEAHDCYGYPVDYLAGAMLVAVGLGIGNTHFARLKGKWDESACRKTGSLQVASAEFRHQTVRRAGRNGNTRLY